MNVRDAELWDRYEDVTREWSEALDLIEDGLSDPVDRVEALTIYVDAARAMLPRLGATADEIRLTDLIREPALAEIDRTVREHPDRFRFDPLREPSTPPWASRWRFLLVGLPGLNGHPSADEIARRIVQRMDDERAIGRTR